MNTNKKFILSIVIISFLFLLSISSAYFLDSNIKSKEQILSEKQDQLFLIEEKIKNATLLEERLTNTREDYLGLKSIFVKKDNIVDFIKNIEYLAQKADIELEIKKADIPKENGSPYFTLNTEGSFSDTYYYILLLENGSYYTKLDEVRIWKTEKDKKQVWTANLELELLNFEND